MKNPSGYGSINRMKGNRRKPYRVRITTGFEINENGAARQIQRTLGTFATYEEAVEALAAYNRNPVSLEPGVTFAELYRRWSAEKYAVSKSAVVKSYTAAFNAVPMLHDLEFRKLKRNALQNAVDTCGKNYPTLQNVKLLLGFLYRYATQNDLVEKDYSRFVDIAKHKPDDPGPGIHTDIKSEELSVLWDHAEDLAVREVLMLIYSGLRVGEFLALTAADLDNGFIIVRDSKTASGRRRVPIASKTAPFWSQLTESAGDGPLVQTANKQEPKSRYQAYKNRFVQIFPSLDLPDHLPHDTRHTTATMLHPAGVDPYTVKKILGHSSQDVTERVYTHISDAELSAAIEKI